MSRQDISGKPQRRFGPILLLLAAVLACLSVLLINRGPLYYFDTGSYFKQGDTALSLILPDRPPEETPVASGQGGTGASQAAPKDKTTSGSRSMVYALLVAALWRADAVIGVVLTNLAALLLTIWLVVRVMPRPAIPDRGTLQLMTLPLMAAAATSLPFYVAFIMPDFFAPIMLILIAAVVALGPRMGLTEYLLALALATFAVVLHPSHLGVAVLMLPVVMVAAVLRIGEGRWLAVGFVAFLVLIALVERKTFEFAAQNVAGKEVHYTPHITARLIADGPGMTYLEENCPRPDLATCALYEALSWSDDPYRLTVSHIIFERSEELGSFRLMTSENQRAVANEQRTFFFRVLAGQPLSTLLALSRNAATQAVTNSVDMTIPTDAVIRNARKLSGLPEERLGILADSGQLARDRSWIGTADTIHSTIYLVSFVIVVGLLLWPGRIAPSLKVFALFLLIGIAVNAVVCGGISQPANRYGARVMWLLPFTAALLLLSLQRYKPGSDTGDHS